VPLTVIRLWPFDEGVKQSMSDREPSRFAKAIYYIGLAQPPEGRHARIQTREG
jgi:hypothetical protein